MSSPSPLRETDPRRVGGFVLTGRIGTGGQGTVYLAEGPDGAPVAVKTLNSEVVDDPGMRQRFVREAQAARERILSGTADVPAQVWGGRASKSTARTAAVQNDAPAMTAAATCVRDRSPGRASRSDSTVSARPTAEQ